MFKKLLALVGTAFLAVNGIDTDYDNMTSEQQLNTVIKLAEVYEDTIPEIIEIRDEIDHKITVASSNYEIPEEEEIVEEEEDFFWQLKPLPR